MISTYRLNVCVYICVCPYMCAYKCVYISLCVYKCVYTFVYMEQTHIYTHIWYIWVYMFGRQEFKKNFRGQWIWDGKNSDTRGGKGWSPTGEILLEQLKNGALRIRVNTQWKKVIVETKWIPEEDKGGEQESQRVMFICQALVYWFALVWFF